MLRLSFFLFITLLFLFSQAVAQSGPFRVSGHVISSEGEELPNASILLDNQRIYSTDLHGDFTITGLNHGSHTFRITYIGFDTLVTKVEVHGDVHLDIILNINEIELKEIVIAGDHFMTGRVEQSQTIQTIDAGFIQQQNSGTLMTSLQKLPGISAINTGVGIAKPVIRGMSFNRVLVMDKGIKQEGQQWGADHGLEIDQYDPERLEIVKGPSSLLYGSDAIGGAIRILPPVLPANDHLAGELFTTYKSNNNLGGLSTAIQGSKNDNFFRMRVSAQDFADYTVPATSFTYNGFQLPIYNNRLKNTAGNELNFSTAVGMHKTWGVTTLTVSNFHQKAGLFAGATGIPREYQLEDDGDPRNIDLPRQVVNHFKVISNTTIIIKRSWIEADLGYQFNDRKEEGAPHAHGYQPTPDGNLALGLGLQTFSGNVRYNKSIGEKLSSSAGLQGQWQINRQSGFEFLLPDFTSGNVGGYLYQEYSPSHHFSMNAGIRYDYGVRNITEHIEPDYTTIEEGDSILRNPEIYRVFHDVSGALGFSYYPSLNFNTKLNIGTSFRMPTPAELSSNGVHHGTFRHEMGDPNLDSERGVQADLNFAYQKNNNSIILTPFLGYFHNYIYLAPQPKFSTLPAGGQLYQYTQHDALFMGLEFSLDVQIVKNLVVSTAMEYVWNQNLDTYLPLPFTPPFSVFGELAYSRNVSNSNVRYWFASVNYHYYAAQDRVDRNELPTPGYGLLSLAAGADVMIKTQRLQFRFSANNLLDIAYMNHLSRYRLLNLPEQGRNLVLSLKIPFGIK